MKPLQAQALFYRIKILSLDVFNQADSDSRLVRHILNDNRDVIQPRHLGGTPAALAREDFIATVCQRPRHDWLQDTLRLNAARQRLQRLLVKLATGLVSAYLQPLDR